MDSQKFTIVSGYTRSGDGSVESLDFDVFLNKEKICNFSVAQNSHARCEWEDFRNDLINHKINTHELTGECSTFFENTEFQISPTEIIITTKINKFQNLETKLPIELRLELANSITSLVEDKNIKGWNDHYNDGECDFI